MANAGDGRGFNIGLWAEIRGGQWAVIGWNRHRGVRLARWSGTMDRISKPRGHAPPPPLPSVHLVHSRYCNWPLANT